MENFSIRIGTTADHSLVVQMLGELVDELGPEATARQVKTSLEEDIRSALSSDHVRVFIAEFEGRPIGLSRADILVHDPIFRLREDNRCGYIDQMFVRPAHRGSGVGEKLLKLCEDWFRECGVGHSLLHAAPKAVRFYARSGYQPNREMFKRL